MRATAIAEAREDARPSGGTSLAHDACVPSTKRSNPPKQARQPEPLPPKVWRWDEVLDAALSLEDTDFIAVLSEMLMVRDEVQKRIGQRAAEYFASRGAPFDDPFDDDAFTDAPLDTTSATVPSPRRKKARKH